MWFQWLKIGCHGFKFVFATIFILVSIVWDFLGLSFGFHGLRFDVHVCFGVHIVILGFRVFVRCSLFGLFSMV